jgi:hypothetical protein
MGYANLLPFSAGQPGENSKGLLILKRPIFQVIATSLAKYIMIARKMPKS